MLEGVFSRLQACRCNILPVLDRGRLVGLVTPENLGEFLAISSALSGESAEYSRGPSLSDTRWQREAG
jgi:hypothetical protein